MEQFNCYVQGFSDHTLDLQQLAVEIGYWSAYYSNAKHPKPVSRIVEMLRKSTVKRKHSEEKPDVETFLQLEKKRLEMLERRDMHG